MRKDMSAAERLKELAALLSQKAEEIREREQQEGKLNG